MLLFRPVLALGALVSLLGCNGTAKDSTPAISAEGIKAHIMVLGNDSLEGRGTGQRGYQHAADYVADQFRRLSLAPGAPDGTFFQPVLLRETTLERAAASLTRGGRTTKLVEGDDFMATGDPGDSATAVEAPVVFVGYGVTAPAFGRDDYAGIDAKGKIVAVISGGPPSLPANPRAHYGGGDKSRNAAEHGAVGMITLWTDEIESVMPWAFARRFLRAPGMTWLDAPGTLPAELPRLPGLMLSAKASATLFAGSSVGWPAAVLAARDGKGTPVALPGTFRIEKISRHRELAVPNVIASLPGSDPALKNEYLVVTAHLDHDGIRDPVGGDSIYNGVIDNAAGVAALLEIAKAFNAGPKPKRSVLFVATAAEEKGLLGAAYFAAHPTVPIGSIVADLNMDGNHLLFPTKSIVALGAEQSSLGGTVAEAAQAVGLELETELMPEQAFFIRSDQYPFIKKGVPALFFINGTRSSDSTVNGSAVLGKWLTTVYHSPKDDLDQKLDWESGAKYARLVYQVGRSVADAPQRPTWTPGDFFGTTFGPKPAAR